MKTSTTATRPPSTDRDRFIDAVRAGALLVVVFGHWLATLPRVQDATTVANDHLLHGWAAAGWLTWVLQVVPVFVMVSAAAVSPPVRGGVLRWWSTRAQRLARPTLTYLAVLTGLWGLARVREPVGVFTQLFSDSLTVHLWFVVMLLLVQAALPWSHRLDRRHGTAAVVGLVTVAVAADVSRFVAAGAGDLGGFGHVVATAAPGLGWLNVVAVWLVPQQLGIAWRAGRLKGRRAGAALLAAGLAWAGAAVALGYPVAMVGADPTSGASNVLPPTAALLGPVAIQAGLVLLTEDPVRRWLEDRARWKVVQLVAALGMPLYLWHKLAELPAVWIANRTGVVLDRGLPGDPGFWAGRAVWLALCTAAVVPVVTAVVTFERRRRAKVPLAGSTWRLAVGGPTVVLAAAVALGGGVAAAPTAAVAMAAGSWLLRSR